MSTFIITGYGRSGTKFLSHIMNKSKDYTVYHEPRSDHDEWDSMCAIETFQECKEQDINYGEVNSRLRHWFNDIKVDKKGVIIRPTNEIVTSIANRKTVNEVINEIDQLNYYHNKFLEWVESSTVERIDFHKMTSNKYYLKEVLEVFDINIPISDVDLTRKVNANRMVIYKSFDELPSEIKRHYFDLRWRY